MGSERGSALVATWRRWASGSALLALGIVLATTGALGFVGAHRSLFSLAAPLALASVVGSLLLLGTLRAEESRLARELRLTRTGTPALRESAIARRDRAPFFARLLSTQLGLAALMLADGDPAGAASVLASASGLARGGRVERLRGLVEADIERASGEPEARAKCIERLRAAAPLGNREADLYRLHVLSKAVLEQGDAGVALEILPELAASRDQDTRIYATWLRVWFDFDSPDAGSRGADHAEPWPELAEVAEVTEGDLRLAALVARAHGADSLVSKLESKLDQRLVAIAHSEGQG